MNNTHPNIILSSNPNIWEYFENLDDTDCLFREFLSKNQPIKVLDLGSSVPINLFLLYHQFETDLLVSVDHCSEMNCVIKFKANEKIQKSSLNSFYDIYKEIIAPQNSTFDKNLDEDLFKKIFIANFYEKSIEEFIEDYSGERFHLIIAYNVLHFIRKDNYDGFFKSLKNILEDDGMILLRIQNGRNNRINNYHQFVVNLKDNFGPGKVYEHKKNDEWDYFIYTNKENYFN